MSKARFTGALVAVVGLVTSLVGTTLATPAQAVVPTERLWAVQDADGDGLHALYYSDGAGGALAKVEGSATSWVYGLGASADGSRIIYVRRTYVAALNDAKQEVVVRDMSKRVVRVLETSWASAGLYPNEARLSPDGTRAVWQLGDGNHHYWVRKAAVSSGAATTLIAGYTPYAFVDNSTVLFQTAAGVTYTMPFTGGTKKAATGIPLDAMYLSVAPDGSHVTWALGTSFDEPLRSDIQVAPLTVTNGVASVGTATTIATGLYNRTPEFSRDGSRVYWCRTSGIIGAAGDVWTAPADGSSPASRLAATATDDYDLAFTSLPSADAAAPGATTNVPAKLKGTAVVLDWTLPANSDLSGTVVTRKTGATSTSFFLPAPISYLVQGGLTLGTTYTFVFAPVDRAGRYGTSSSRTLTALEAKPTMADPTSLTSAKAAFPVRFGPVGPAGVTFDADYLQIGGPSWVSWVLGAGGVTRTFGAPASAGVAETTSTPGTTYSFRSRAHDAYGNSTDWAVGKTLATVPFDQTKATFQGGGNVYTSAAYLGSYRKLWRSTDYARVTVTGDRFYVIGTTCGTCGKFDLFDNGAWIGTIDTYGTVTRLRQTLLARSVTAGTHTFTIKARATAGRPDVMLDGFGIRLSSA